MVHAALNGDWDQAREIHRMYLALFKALLTLDTNPVPVKAALAMMGLVEPQYRLPLCPMSEQAHTRLRTILSELSLV
jgi:4-hydroxy-tetrahydrodipicolinate synthase